MKASRSVTALTLALSGVAALLCGCPGDDAPPGNPSRLWLALDGSEVEIRLTAVEPPPF